MLWVGSLEPAARKPLQRPPRSGSRSDAGPIVVAVDDTRSATAATQAAVRLAQNLGAPLVFVYVRRGRRLRSVSRITSVASTARCAPEIAY
jgi:K+-sensing histidine kinase KdpD